MHDRESGNKDRPLCPSPGSRYSLVNPPVVPFSNLTGATSPTFVGGILVRTFPMSGTMGKARCPREKLPDLQSPFLSRTERLEVDFFFCSLGYLIPPWIPIAGLVPKSQLP